jgi:hypothetical protein
MRSKWSNISCVTCSSVYTIREHLFEPIWLLGDGHERWAKENENNMRPKKLIWEN